MADVQNQLAELRREIARLKEDVDIKENKLSSSMRSIKMFWSPELKKERAARKSETERYHKIKEQFSTIQNDLEQKAKNIRELQHELGVYQGVCHKVQTGELSPSATLSVLEQEIRDTNTQLLQEVTEGHEAELYIFHKTIEDLEEKLESQQNLLSERDETIQKLMDMLQSGECFAAKSTKTSAEDEEKITTLERSITEKNTEINSLREVVHKLQTNHDASDSVQNELLRKDKKITALEMELDGLENQITELRDVQAADEQKRAEEQKQTEIYQSHSKFMKAKIESLKTELAKKETALSTSDTKQVTIQAQLSDQQEHISVLQSSLSNKEQHMKHMQAEMDSIMCRLEDKEKSAIEKDENITKLTSQLSDKTKSYESLQSVTETKERQLTDLRLKVSYLEKDLLEKDSILRNAKAQVSVIQSEHQDSSVTISGLECSLQEKEQHIELLQKQRDRHNIEHEQEMKSLQSRYDNTRAQMGSLKDTLAQKEDEISDLVAQLATAQSTGKLKANKLETLERTLHVREEEAEQLRQALDEQTRLKEKLHSELNTVNSKMSSLQQENSQLKKDLSQAQKSCQESDKKAKQLQTDLTGREERIQELDKQLKDQGRKVSTMKRNQQLDREKQLQSGTQNDELRDELKSRDERISVLEEALKESVNIAAEREELLAQQGESADNATHKVGELETELERAKVETVITNTKNASLISALGEKDIVLSYYKNERHRMLAEYLDMKQNALLAAISEKDANIALLELSPYNQHMNIEVKRLRGEKDQLVKELKDQTQKRMNLLNNDGIKGEISLHVEMSQASKDMIIEAIELLEEGRQRLKDYVDDLVNISEHHFPEVLKDLPQQKLPKTLQDTGLESLAHSEVLQMMKVKEEQCRSLQNYVHKLLENIEEHEM